MWILETITKYTGVTDEAELREIYDFMADQIPSFGNASPEKLRREARAAKATVDYLKTDAGKAEWNSLMVANGGEGLGLER